MITAGRRIASPIKAKLIPTAKASMLVAIARRSRTFHPIRLIPSSSPKKKTVPDHFSADEEEQTDHDPVAERIDHLSYGNPDRPP